MWISEPLNYPSDFVIDFYFKVFWLSIVSQIIINREGTFMQLFIFWYYGNHYLQKI